MSHLDPQNPKDREEILGYLIDEVVEELGAEFVLELLTQSQENIDSLATTSSIGSVEELNEMLTDFHFSQQIIFDYYPPEEDWEY